MDRGFKKIIIALSLLFVFSAFLVCVDFPAISYAKNLSNPEIQIASVRVRGYYRKDGTYVQPHYRSNPDSSPYNNWSYPGNVNPYTGKVAPGNPETYLKKYRSGSGVSSGSPSLKAPTPTYKPPTWEFNGKIYHSYSEYLDAKAEYEKWAKEHKDNIRNLYRNILEREPYSEDEVNYWFNREKDIKKIEQAFYKSDEYKELQEKLRKQEEERERQQETISGSYQQPPEQKSLWQTLLEWLFG